MTKTDECSKCRMDYGWHAKDCEALAAKETDMVNAPPHYTGPLQALGLEVIQVTELFGFCLGNALKYIFRADWKGRAIEDLRKAVWYLEREIARREAGE
jgi:hypothetical protein